MGNEKEEQVPGKNPLTPRNPAPPPTPEKKREQFEKIEERRKK